MRVLQFGSGEVGKGDKEETCEKYHIERNILESSVPS